MLGGRRLVVDTMCEVYQLLRNYIEEEFWDFTRVKPYPGSIYVLGRQHLLDNLSIVRAMAESGQYIIVFDNSAEGSRTLETQIRQLKIDELSGKGQLLIISGGPIPVGYPHVVHEHLLTTILDYEENIRAQQFTDDIFSKVDKPYQFLFLNGRARPHRKYLYERFKRLNLLEHALYTMLDNRPTVVRHFTFWENDTNIMATPSDLRYLPSAYEVDRYRQPVFETIIPDNTFIKQELFNREWGEIYLEPLPYIDTYFSLVTETLCAETDLSFRTEKIAKPLVMGHPFIVAANRGYYRDLRNLGFQTFSHLIDESFDDIDNAQDRMDRLTAVVSDLCQQNLSLFLGACRGVCKYNQQHLADFARLHRLQFPQVFEKLVTAHG